MHDPPPYEPAPEAPPTDRRPSRILITHATDGSVRFEQRFERWSSVCFALFWLAPWTVVSVLALIAGAQGQAVGFVLSVPLWAAWAFVLGAMLDDATRRLCLTATHDGVLHQRRSLVSRIQRLLTRDEILHIEPHDRPSVGENEAIHCVRIHTPGHPLDFGERLRPGEQHEIVEQLRQTLRVKPDATAPEPSDDPTLPSDSRLQLHTTDDTLTIRRPGARSRSLAFGWLLACLFSNGIVAVFVLMVVAPQLVGGGPSGWGRVGLALFLVPFVLGGLLLAAMTIVAWLGPRADEQWQFSPGQCQHAYRAWGRRVWWKTHRLPDQASPRIEYHPAKPSEAQSEKTHPPYTVTWSGPVDGSGLKLKYLTQGEAGWVADVLASRPK